MATPPPSQFAALLRRSKFASFDPRIGQVYTSFDGHAARGNFGLKRPLAIRRRNAHITVQAVDSREQQTVWRSAESEGRWIKMWDETGVKPTLGSKSWEAKVGATDFEYNFVVDSEFTRPVQTEQAVEEEQELEAKSQEAVEDQDVKDKPRTPAIPNFDAMSEREFQRYLVRIRELRPAFHQYVASKRGTQYGGRTLFRTSIRHGDDFKEFLETHAYEEYHARRPRYIQQQPHRFGGLSYTHSSHVDLRYTTKPHIGRVLPDPDNTIKGNLVNSVGMVSYMKNGDRGEDVEPVSTFRFGEAILKYLPATVDPRPEGLEGTRVIASVFTESPRVEYRKPNPHTPGSRDYVGQSGELKSAHSGGVNITTHVPQPLDSFAPSAKPAAKLLSALAGITQPRSST
ncbi:mitochondrial ribosomal protein subunit-domain-containing protein [Daedaleopsis nitida]|nr:mitochondrial ribosomal protein subunit-domain-containing protein [Daedaleopsis nitida]